LQEKHAAIRRSRRRMRLDSYLAIIKIQLK
jgi:hypothetical protein